MLALHKDKLIYIVIQKNGSTTFGTLLINNGWKEIDLFQTNLDLSNYILWGHITDPNKRHTKGLAQFLKSNPDIDISNESVGKLIISGIFDGHSSSIHQLLGSLFYLPIHWIPLDAEINNYAQRTPMILNGNDLTNDFFIENGLSLRITDNDILHREKDHISEEKTIDIRNKIDELKKKWPENTRTTFETFFKQDTILYTNVMKTFTEKYTKSRCLSRV